MVLPTAGASPRPTCKILFQMTIFPATWVTLAAFGLSVALGVLFGSYPAAKASKLQPVEALRAD